MDQEDQEDPDDLEDLDEEDLQVLRVLQVKQGEYYWCYRFVGCCCVSSGFGIWST